MPSVLCFSVIFFSTIHFFLRLCIPSASLCAICVSVCHLCLCAPSASLCAICTFVCHLRLCAPSVIHFYVSFHHCLHCRMLLLPLVPLHTATASATTAHHHYHCCTPPLLLLHATTAAATTRRCQFSCHLCSFCSCCSANHRHHRDGGGLCHTMACISLPLPAASLPQGWGGAAPTSPCLSLPHAITEPGGCCHIPLPLPADAVAILGGYLCIPPALPTAQRLHAHTSYTPSPSLSPLPFPWPQSALTFSAPSHHLVLKRICKWFTGSQLTMLKQLFHHTSHPSHLQCKSLTQEARFGAHLHPIHWLVLALHLTS